MISTRTLTSAAFAALRARVKSDCRNARGPRDIAGVHIHRRTRGVELSRARARSLDGNWNPESGWGARQPSLAGLDLRFRGIFMASSSTEPRKRGLPPFPSEDWLIRFPPPLIDAIDCWRGLDMTRSAAVRHFVEAGLKRRSPRKVSRQESATGLKSCATLAPGLSGDPFSSCRPIRLRCAALLRCPVQCQPKARPPTCARAGRWGQRRCAATQAGPKGHGARSRRSFPGRSARPATLPHLRTLRCRSLPPNAPAPPPLGVFARRASKIFGWWLLGLGRPSLFDDRTNAPRAVPRVLTRSQRAGLVKL
jgi:hypothetical protein